MPNTPSMKSLLICLLPWMAMTAAATEEAPRQVQVVYSNIGPADAWRVGDECYIAPSVLTAWHWAFTMVGSQATISAEGRTLKVPTRIVHDRVLIPVRSLFEQLGANCIWRTNEELDVLGQVRIVTLRNGALGIDSTISCRPHVFSLTDPSRFVVELRGMTLAKTAGDGLPDSVRASQFAGDTVRIVYESPNVPRMEIATGDPARHFEYKVDFKASENPSYGVAPLVNRPPLQEPEPEQSTEPPPMTGTSPPSGGSVQASSPQIISENARAVTLRIPLSGSVAEPKVRHTDPNTLELTLPSVQVSGDFKSVESNTIQSIEAKPSPEGTVLQVRTTRPVGSEVTVLDRAIELTLTKPTANGGLSGKLIVIDPGHGGQDSGCHSPDHRVLEKNLTLLIGKDLADDLAEAGATVIMTRKTDVFIPLKERPAIANRNNADMFISIHINSNVSVNSRSGTTTYYHGHNEMSELLAQCVEHEISRVSGIPALGAASDFSVYHNSGFAVLRYSKMPAILVETGFLNCDLDRSKMCTTDFQSTVARAIVRGLRVYLGDASDESQ